MNIYDVYYFNEFRRLNLVWSSPNELGAYSAMVVAILWGIRSSGRSGLIAKEAVAAVHFLILALTYSRGGVFALVVACAAMFVPEVKDVCCALKKRTIILWSCRGVLACAVLLSVGFFGRVSPRYLAGDGSVGNRFLVWRAAVDLLIGSGVHGWGWGQSGDVYMKYKQAYGDCNIYNSMLNSYLTLGVEGGVGIFFVATFIVFFVLYVTYKLASVRGVFPVALLGVCVCWVVLNAFTVLYENVALWGGPIFLMVCFAVEFARGNRSKINQDLFRRGGCFLLELPWDC